MLAFLVVCPEYHSFPSELQVSLSLFIKLNFLSLQIELIFFYIIFNITLLPICLSPKFNLTDIIKIKAFLFMTIY